MFTNEIKVEFKPTTFKCGMFFFNSFVFSVPLCALRPDPNAWVHENSHALPMNYFFFHSSAAAAAAAVVCTLLRLMLLVSMNLCKLVCAQCHTLVVIVTEKWINFSEFSACIGTGPVMPDTAAAVFVFIKIFVSQSARWIDFFTSARSLRTQFAITNWKIDLFMR